MVLAGRLGLETARIPHADRHGLVWLARGHLCVEDGTLHFQTAGSGDMKPGDYAIPFQMVSILLLGPGSTVSHDALRLCARHGTCLVAVGEDGVRAYTAPPAGTRSLRPCPPAGQLMGRPGPTTCSCPSLICLAYGRSAATSRTGSATRHRGRAHASTSIRRSPSNTA